MIYYRVAFRVEHSSAWKWRSSILTSTHALFTLLKGYHALPQEHILVFFTASKDEMDEMLTRQNLGLVSSSVTIDQFLARQQITPTEVKRLEYELSKQADHDEPYIFTLPTALPELSSWTKLMVKVQRGELEP